MSADRAKPAKKPKAKPAKKPKARTRKKPSKATAKTTEKKTESPNASRAMLIVNPAAGNGAALKVWDELQETLFVLGLDFDYRFTEYTRHAVELAVEAAKSGFGTVVVVGGDGTIFEVTNGLMAVEAGARPAMGIIPFGRGSDFCRSVEVPQDWKVAAPLLTAGRKRRIDVGLMEYHTPEGVKKDHYANIAGLGFDGEVTERANNMPEGVSKALGGIGSYMLSLLVTYTKFREKDVELHVDDRMYRVLATTVVVANGQYFGGKMRIAPDAVTDDGLFDVVVVGPGFGPPVLELPTDVPPPEHSRLERAVAKVKMATDIIPKLYKGTHVQNESVMVTRGKSVKVLSDDRMVLQADGEVIGVGPLKVELIPGAIEIIS